MKVAHFQENKLGKDYVVGDIHGCFSKLQSALWLMEFDESKDRLFSVGDLVDRGPESEESIDWIAKPWFHAVRGNHEQMAIDYADGFSDDYYVHNGGGWMMRLPKSQQRLYADVFKDLPIAIDITVGDKLYGIVHAEASVKSWKDIGKACEQSVMWDRFKYNSKDESFIEDVERVYVGHTPTKQVVILGNVHYIDTGAVFKNGSLTIVDLY